MKKILNLIKLEFLSITRAKFHFVLLITLAALIGSYYLIPDKPDSSLQVVESATVSVTVLESHEKTSLRDLFLPILMSFEVVILGFLFVAITMFQEKEDGVVRAYRISPSSSATYAFSKILAWTAISCAYGLIFTAATRFRGINYSHLLILIFASSFLMTSLGMLIAVFFNSISDWFFPGVSILVVNMLPQIALGNPSFNPMWLRIIPGYHMAFGFKDIFSPGNSSAIQIGVFSGLFIAGLILFVFAVLAVNAKLMKEGKQ